MRGEQLTRQWRILRAIESKNQGATVAELAQQEGFQTRTIWQDLAAIQNPQLLLLFQFNPMLDSQHQRKAQLSRQDLQRETHLPRWSQFATTFPNNQLRLQSSQTYLDWSDQETNN